MLASLGGALAMVSHSYCPPPSDSSSPTVPAAAGLAQLLPPPPSDSSSPTVPAAAGLAPAPLPPLDVVAVGRRMPLADVAMTPRACLCIRTVVQPEVREG